MGASQQIEIKDVDQFTVSRHSDDIELLIVTAVEVETRQVIEYLRPLPGQGTLLRCYSHTDTYILGLFGAFPAVHVQCEMGSGGRKGSTLVTAKAIQVWDPRVVLMPGIAFGKGGKQEIGDVLVARAIIPYELMRIGTEPSYWGNLFGRIKVTPRGVHAPSGITLYDRFTSLAPMMPNKPTPFQHHPGPILSGEKLIDNKRIKKALFATFPTALGGEMEGTGVADAAANNERQWIVVKAICDWGNGSKDKAHQEMAARNSVALCHFVFSQQLGFVGFVLTVSPGAPHFTTSRATKISKASDVHTLMGLFDRAAKDLPPTVQILVEHMSYVAAELALNAFEHGGATFSTIEIRADEIEVRDDGRPFHPLESAVPTPTFGRGTGLLVIQRFMREFDGQVSLLTSLDGTSGNRYRFKLLGLPVQLKLDSETTVRVDFNAFRRSQFDPKTIIIPPGDGVAYLILTKEFQVLSPTVMLLDYILTRLGPTRRLVVLCQSKFVYSIATSQFKHLMAAGRVEFRMM